MSCERCGVETPDRWCPDCERAYDTWVRRHASDIIFPAIAGMLMVAGIAIGLPLLGVHWVVAVTGIFGGSATILGLHRLNARRRRRQFLQDGGVPRAYLTTKT